MEAVAASRMRRAQAQTQASRPYAQRAWEVLTFLARQTTLARAPHPLLQQRPIKKIGLVLITPDRGLCGALIANVLRSATAFMKARADQGTPVTIISVGRKGRDFMLRFGRPIMAEFSRLGDQPTLLEVTPIARLAIDSFLSGEFDAIYLAYTDFVNVMTQRPAIRQILPITPAEIKEPGTGFAADYIYEPDPETILAAVLPRLTELQIYQAVLESIASEHSARMVAMRHATENAQDLVEDLTLTYNKARQTVITREMLDIAGGTEALAKARAVA